MSDDKEKDQFLTEIVDNFKDQGDSKPELNDVEDTSDLLNDNCVYLTEENEDELTTEDPIPTFAVFKANNFGAPTKYNQDIPQALFEFYHKPRMRVVKEKAMSYGKPIIKTYEVPERFPTVEYFCSLQGITKKTFYNWLKVEPELLHAYEACKLWAKDVLVQNALEGKWNYKVVVLVAQNYTEIREVPDDAGMVPGEESTGVEIIPPKKKGYDISEIDKYRSKPTIETTAKVVTDGEKKSV